MSNQPYTTRGTSPYHWFRPRQSLPVFLCTHTHVCISSQLSKTARLIISFLLYVWLSKADRGHDFKKVQYSPAMPFSSTFVWHLDMSSAGLNALDGVPEENGFKTAVVTLIR